MLQLLATVIAGDDGPGFESQVASHMAGPSQKEKKETGLRNLSLRGGRLLLQNLTGPGRRSRFSELAN